MKRILNLAAVAVLSLGSLMAGTLQYEVTVNTAGLNDMTEVDFELAPGLGVPLTVQAIVSSFTPQGNLTGVEGAYLGSPTGSVTSTLTMSNEAGGDGYFAGYTPGNEFRFLLTLTGAGVGAGAGGSVPTNFRVLLLDGSLNVLAGGPVVDIELAASGEATVNFNSRIATVEAIPEPASWMLMGAALVVVVRRVRA